MSSSLASADANHPAFVLREDSNGIARLTLNRPASRNALSMEMMASLIEVLAEIAEDKAIKCIILAANGPGFCAGHDLKQLMGHKGDVDYYRRVFERCSQLMTALVRQPQVVIAEVHGIAAAAGTQLVASCDLAIAGDDTKFALPGVNIGLFCSTPMVAVSRNLARKHVMEMLVTGDMVSAEKAAETGLINRAVGADKLTAETESLAATIVSKSSHTMKIGKEAFYHQVEMSLDDAYAYTGEVMAQNMLAADAEEGITAFIDKRPPNWSGK
jgi:enoyl-CoA hydratase/carnithine racemase